MPATSKSQQRLFGLARAIQKGDVKGKPGTPSAKIAKDVEVSDVKKFAGTKTKKLPEKVSEGTERVARLFGRTFMAEDAVKLSKGTGADTPATKAYHRMTSAQAMRPEWKPKTYIRAAGELSGMDKSGQIKGFKNKSEGQTTSGRSLPKKRAGESMVARKVADILIGD